MRCQIVYQMIRFIGKMNGKNALNQKGARTRVNGGIEHDYSLFCDARCADDHLYDCCYRCNRCLIDRKIPKNLNLHGFWGFLYDYSRERRYVYSVRSSSEDLLYRPPSMFVLVMPSFSIKWKEATFSASHCATKCLMPKCSRA